MYTMDGYQQAAVRTAPKDKDFNQLIDLCALGITGEGGEVADHVKKILHHGHEVNETEIIKELGDIMWYIANMAICLGYTLDEVAAINIDKLQKRYPKGFSAERSINRNDGE